MSIFNSDFELGDITSILKDVNTRVHFIGILGAGMYPLARLLRARGYFVSGSDDKAKCEYYKDDYGIAIGRPRDSIECDIAIYSLAIDESNTEIRHLRALGIPLVSRAQLLGAVMSAFKTRISVSGSHGKSTTTAAIDHILCASDTQHTTVSGAALSCSESLFDGGGEIFVAEACEYKDSFLRLCPSHQIITSVELDHTDYFSGPDMLKESFIKSVSDVDVALINVDDQGAREIYTALRSSGGQRRIYTYGKSDAADYRFYPVGHCGEITHFSVVSRERTFSLRTDLMGEFNLYNLTAATAMADIIGIDQGQIEEAVATFHAIDRRLTLLSSVDGTKIYYDYAHHPTEIGATIFALKERYGTVTVIFRPHTYSRTKSLWNDFIAEFSKAEFTIVLDIYPAREEYIDGVDAEKLASEIPGGIYTAECDAARIALSHHTGAVVLMGAGDVESIKQELIELGKNTG